MIAVGQTIGNAVARDISPSGNGQNYTVYGGPDNPAQLADAGMSDATNDPQAQAATIAAQQQGTPTSPIPSFWDDPIGWLEGEATAIGDGIANGVSGLFGGGTSKLVRVGIGPGPDDGVTYIDASGTETTISQAMTALVPDTNGLGNFFSGLFVSSANAAERSHTGAQLYQLNQLPRNYQTYLQSRNWQNPTRMGIRGQDSGGNGAFGAPRSDGTLHGGVDYLNQTGQTVYAPVSGRVFSVRPVSGMGTVRIDAGDGIHVEVLYTNPTVRVDDQVTVGDPIGTADDIHGHYPQNVPEHTHMQIKIPAINAVVNPTDLIPH